MSEMSTDARRTAAAIRARLRGEDDEPLLAGYRPATVAGFLEHNPGFYTADQIGQRLGMATSYVVERLDDLTREGLVRSQYRGKRYETKYWRWMG